MTQFKQIAEFGMSPAQSW